MVMVAAALLTAVPPAWAYKPGPEGPDRGDVMKRLPDGHHRIDVRGKAYFHHGGRFYRHGPGGYVPVPAPRGAIIHDLPLGFATLVLAGITYFTFAGIYYRQVADGYMVVEKPVERVIVEKETKIVVPSTPVGTTVAVTVERLNVRSGPGKAHAVTDLVHRDDHLVIRGYAPDWYFVELPSGRFGWVMTQFTDPVPAPGADASDEPTAG